MRARIVLVACFLLVAACTSSSNNPPPPPPSTTLPGTSGGTSSQQPPIVAGTQRVAVTVGSESRQVLLVRPAAGARRRPLVIFLHGAKSQASTVRRQLHLGDMAREAGVLTAYPEGAPSVRSWRSGCCNSAADSDADFRFVKALIDTLVADNEVDPKRVVLAGFSAGALFANSFACRYPGLLRGAVAVAGSLLTPPSFVTDVSGSPTRCTPSRPVTVLALRGTQDTSIPIAGRTRDCSTTCEPGAAGYIAPAALVDAWWRRMDTCSAATVRRNGSSTVSIAPCRGGTQVGLALLNGPGHNLDEVVRSFPLRETLVQLVTGRPLAAW